MVLATNNSNEAPLKVGIELFCQHIGVKRVTLYRMGV